ncbi:MAG: NUDIX domain-containing protein [Marmoricola sp.]
MIDLAPALLVDALAVLDRWAAPSASQEVLRTSYAEHLRAQPAGLFKSCYPDHLTASALVLSADRSQVLLTLHRRAQQWFQFGGHLERGDASLHGAALREATEESGVDTLVVDPEPVHLDVHGVPFCDPRGGARHLDVRFSMTAPDGTAHTVSKESLDVRWWSVHDLPTDERSIHELVELALARG